MLDGGIKAQLRGYLEKLAAPVEVVAALDGSDGAAEMRAFLADLDGLSPKLVVRVDDAPPPAVRRPSFPVTR